ncbi:phosphoribosylaminoimidazole synthetase [Geobacillus icigianus]|uniref:Phosphoribosylaminoimidazole synthetase n=1 Tax=Geobacillus subterraneus TaxID=129338 RepID=A0A679FR98_9BACL|nr:MULTISPECIES: hypothetical protein [Geobacillus]BBW98643.1 hypothetical protein GsuE55_34760 [Geobacillus subterraneus]
MKARCIANTGKDISEKALSIGYSTETVFELEIGRVYTVYGVCLWRDSLHYLIKGEEHNYPSWYPSELFDVSDRLLPVEWYYDYFRACDITAIWGYKELVEDDSHFDGLMERDNKALEVFLKRKQEIDDYI